MKRFLIGLLAILALASPASARDNAGAVYLVTAPAALDPGSAYLLLRTSTAKSGMFPLRHVLLRIPSAEELDAYRTAKQAAYTDALPKLTARAKGGKVPTIDEFEFDYPGKANTFVVDSGKFIEDGEMRTILVQVPPGTYIIYGSTLGGRGLVVCNCLGTVQFVAKAGVITDMGSLYVDKVHKESPVPHLEDNLGPQMFQYGLILGQALVPADAATPVPAGLRALTIEQARFQAVGQFYEPGAGWINRLPPIPGILGYERGRPIDLRTGRRAE
jgi:hypothetical protein